jgi:CDP-diacylglycerol pyrophosphatase
MRARRWLALCLPLGLAMPPVAARADDPSALWKIVNGQCVPDEQTKQNPAPCAEVDLVDGATRGYAVLKDRRGVAQYLLIPTARISGIDDPAILAPDAVNYFAAAWQARHFTENRLGSQQPRDAIVLAINSAYGRSQDQLHIHIDCVRPDVRRALTDHLEQVGSGWTPFPVPLVGHGYRAIRVNGDTLEGVNPFRVLADGDTQAAGAMARQTLVVVGEDFPDGSKGFVILDGTADPASGNFGSGEDLQDHSCAIARP